MSPDRRGTLLVTAAAVAWSTTGLFTRALDLDAGTMLVWRGVFGALGLVVFLGVVQGRGGLAGFARLGRAGWLYAVISGASMLCFIGSLRLTTVAHVAIIYAVVPFLAAGLGWVVLKHRPGLPAMVASGAALTGAVVMVGFGGDGGALGDLMALAMTFGMAALMVIARARPGIPTIPAATVSALLAAAAALPFAAALTVTAPQALGLAAFGLVNSTAGLALFLLGSALIAPVKTALVTALDAPLAPLWVWVIYAETPSGATVAGGVIVMAAVVGYVLRDQPRPRQAPVTSPAAAPISRAKPCPRKGASP